ncbi:thiamine pyrophosphate-dependent dehydrogenase E1 component subunit alpha [Halocalculus aciditolerans]|uniref:Pyruvate dehydrogenase (Acetyl-transferring) E1 component subunit alpha n=1 Tax=Halocalculus aciditolerans TaxID=1383812 RepID=A0A830F7J3_9EURY|nr:thiamine pyrophosphate-dependent enzyme [Halocalculus aciditolerans]GGL48453.1 pyruvate dehydrogenase (acetyl-transferring) E1 component subunit alpha [Halocalculus aciditolerans]
MALWSERRPSDDFHRVLAPDGSLVGDPPELGDDELKRLYRSFLQTRRLEEKLLRMQRRGEISIIARSLGEEAVALGSAAALAAGDWCFPTYRQTAARAYWGSPVDRSVASLMGAETETVNEHLPPDEEGEGVVFTPPYVPLTVNVTNAVGSAMADRFRGTDTVSLAYVGEGSTSEGDFHEALNFAGVYDAPVVTVCQNNQWAISVPAHRQTAAETFAQKADAHGVPHERVDGNDVLAMYEATKEAVKNARDGGGPAFIEAVTYRRVEHNTADEPGVYRDEEEAEYWAERDPLDRFDAYLRREGVIDDDWVEAVGADVDAEVQAGVERAREVPESDPERMFDNHLHGEPSWTARHQRAELRAEQRGENPFTDFDGSGL